MINKFIEFVKNKLSKRSPTDLPENKAGDNSFNVGVKLPGDQEPFVVPTWKERMTETITQARTRLTQINLKELKLPTVTNIRAPGAAATSGSSILSPSLSKSVEKFMSREFRETIHQLSLIVIVCGITYTIGKITALVLKGTPSLDSAKNYTTSVTMDQDFNVATLGQVKSINIFKTNAVGKPKSKVADVNCEKASGSSSLPIKLLNTVVLQDTVKSIASVQVRGDRLLQEVREGDQITNLAMVFKITRLELLVKNLESGACESIASDKAKEVKSPISIMSPAAGREFKANKKMNGIDNDGNKFKISKALLDEKMKDIAAILTQAKALKIQNPDGSISFKLTEMDPQGIFPYLGLQDQDIITSINGKAIYDMNEVMGLFSRIKNLDNLQLGVKREGADSLQEYSIKQ
ncbi:MAG TPA: hypothetical protein VNJ01_07265 [Bacteriovoracaceae bacterium]|nr:hypothetical protein [Bacteriovoracaceae bacterium]